MATTLISNLNNWMMNETSPLFNNSFSNDVNELSYMGGSGYERIYFPLMARANEECYLTLNFHSPSGFQCSYGDSQEYICFTANEPSNQNELARQTILVSVAVDSVASDTPVEYTVRYTSPVDTIIYAVIDFGYMLDNVYTELVYSNITTNGIVLWNVDNGKLTHSHLPELLPLLSTPYPPDVWVMDNGKFTKLNLPDILNSGAFADCESLRVAKIPQTVKSIGEQAFMNTALTAVTISRDCEFSETSFPPRCIINYYT